MNEVHNRQGPRPRRRTRVWWLAVAAALIAQSWIVLAPLSEGRGLGASAHVEAYGTRAHFAHDEAICAACSVLALHAAPPPERPQTPDVHSVAAAIPEWIVSAAATGELGPTRSRAPPAPTA